MSSSGKFNQLLARVNFPLYTVHCLTERHVLVAGGGGGAKTGIRNVIEIYELYNTGSMCRAESVTHFETGSEAVMNCTIYNTGKFFLLFAGMEGNCQVYKIKYGHREKEHESIDKSDKLPRMRNTLKENQTETVPEKKVSNDISDKNANFAPSRMCFSIQHLETFQTDFSEEPFQKIVRFSNNSKVLVTAGADGCIRIWKYPKFNLLHKIEAHKDDVDDIDICFSGQKLASVSRDGHGKIWNIEGGTLLCDLKYNIALPSQEKYIFRSCRFGIDEKNDSVLFGTLNPSVRKKPPSKCYICKWNTKNYGMEKISSTGTDMLSVMAVSNDGHFVGLGTQEGSVKIYIAFSLQLVYKADRVHNIFVTGLEFLPTSEESRRITGGHEASLISISVDNHINIHHIPLRATMGILPLTALLILMLFFIFVIMDFLNL